MHCSKAMTFCALRMAVTDFTSHDSDSHLLSEGVVARSIFCDCKLHKPT